jgi:hypothetical protein
VNHKEILLNAMIVLSFTSLVFSWANVAGCLGAVFAQFGFIIELLFCRLYVFSVFMRGYFLLAG